jgi:hypothetical protein
MQKCLRQGLSGLHQHWVPRKSLGFEGFEKSESSSSIAPSNAGTLQRIWATGQKNASHTILGKGHLALQQKRRSVMLAAFSKHTRTDTQLDVAGKSLVVAYLFHMNS